MPTESPLERRFWRFWLSGILLLAVQIVMNVWLITDVSPLGISDHQAAGNAARIDAIHSSWTASGVMHLAIAGMILDLIFIGVYAWGAFAGGRMFASSGRNMLSRLGSIIMVAAVGFCIADYAETICQLVQATFTGGNDKLASTAANARPVKTVLFLVTFFGLMLGLFIRRMTRRTA